MIPYGRQSIEDEEIRAVEAVLRSDFVTQGPQTPAFEASVRTAVGARHGVAVNSATSALHVACLALGLGPGKRLWTSPNSFVASSNVGLLCGADVDFVDVDPASFNMCADILARKLEAAAAAGAPPDVVMPVHFGGEPCDMPAIGALARRYGFRVIEDASHAIGARCGAGAVGACDHSDVAVFSFHPVKIVTTGEGGMAVTNDDGLAAAMARLRTHGVTRDEAVYEGEPDGPWSYQQIELGLNYRMTELQSALGVAQMARLGDFIDRRHALAARYDAAFADAPLIAQTRGAANRSALHLYVVRLNDADRRREVFEALRAAGIGVNVHYIPIHTQPYYRRLGFKPGDFPNAEGYYAGAISLPMFPTLTEADQDYVIRTLLGLLG